MTAPFMERRPPDAGVSQVAIQPPFALLDRFKREGSPTALVIRQVFTALMITLFVLIAKILEALTVGRGRQGVQRRG
jgi:hypothetical protein